MSEINYLTQKDLQKWQKKLNLTDWTIELKQNCPLNEFVLDKVKAETEWNFENKTAIIRMIADNEYTDTILPYHKEKVLVHELLHIKFAVLWENNSDIQNMLLHQIIEELARILTEKGEK
jgi:hypothetical protein